MGVFEMHNAKYIDWLLVWRPKHPYHCTLQAGKGVFGSALRELCARPCPDPAGPGEMGSRGPDTYPNQKHEQTWYPPYFEGAESTFALYLPRFSGLRGFLGQTKAL